MNYQHIYDSLIEKAKSRVLSGDEYKEIHHIIPKCMGGTDDPENLVPLPPEEHSIAHKLLVKIHPDVPGLLYACIAMLGNPHGKRLNNKSYGWIRRRVSEERKGVKASEETRQKLSKIRREQGVRPPNPQGRRASEEAKANMSKAQKGLKKPESMKEKLREIRTGTKQSEETKKKLSAMRKGVPKSESHKRAIADSLRGKKYSPERIAAMVEGRRKKGSLGNNGRNGGSLKTGST